MAERVLSGDEWRKLLGLVDRHLDAPARLVVIGGGAIALEYSSAYATRDLDSATQLDGRLAVAVDEARHEIQDQLGLAEPPPVSSTGVYDAPEGFEARCERVALPGAKHLEVFVPERHDLALMKTARGDERDIAALAAMHRGGHPFELAVLVERYHEMLVVGPQERFRGNVLTLVDELYGERVAAALEPRLKQLEGEPRRLDPGQETALARALTEDALRDAGRNDRGPPAAPDR